MVMATRLRTSLYITASLTIGLAALACQGRAGAVCQRQSDCRVGFVCSKPAQVDGGQPPELASGICEPAQHGLGEICLYSGECQSGLGCSNARGEFTADGRHGTCQLLPPDAIVPADMSATD